MFTEVWGVASAGQIGHGQRAGPGAYTQYVRRPSTAQAQAGGAR